MAAISWKSGQNGDWGTAGDWSNGHVPGSGDAVTIAASGNYTVTISSAEAANSLVLNASGAELLDTSSLSIGTSFTETAGFVILQAGSIIGGKMSIAAGASVASAGASSMSAALTSNGEIDVSTGTLILSQGGSIAGTLDGSGTLALSGGTFTAAGGATLLGVGYEQLTNNAVMLATVTANGATSTVGSSVSFGIDAGGTLAIAKNAVFLDTGTLTLGSTAGQGFVSGPGTLSTTGDANIADAGTNVSAVTLSGTLTWQNSGVVDVYGYASIGASSSDTVSIVNQAATDKQPGGSFYFTDDDGTLAAGNAGKAVFTNAGTLSKTGGTGTSTISMVVNSTGVLGASSGTLALTGGGSIAGTVSGAGTVALKTQNYTLGAVAGAGTLLVNTGNSLTETATASVSAGLIVGDSSMLVVAAGKTLTFGGPLTLGDAGNNGGVQYGLLDGPGTLTTTGATSIVDDPNTNGNPLYEAFIGGNITWINAATGTVTVSGLAELALNGGASDGATIINQGNFDFAGDDAQLIQDQPATDSFSNSGTLAKIASLGTGTSTGTSTLAGVISNTGLINVAVGTLDLSGGGSIGGTVSGAGTVQLANASANASFTLGAIAGGGTLDIFGNHGAYVISATETLSATVSPSVIVQDDATLAVAAGKNLTLGGTLTLGDATNNSGAQYGVLSGPGTLTTTGATSIVDDSNTNGAGLYEAFIGGNITWINTATGTVTISGLAEFALNGGGSDNATIINQGNFDFAGNDAQLIQDQAATDQFTNTGTLAKLSGSNSSTLAATVTSTGLISAAAGTLSISGGGSIGGTVSGAGTVQLANADANASFTLGAIAGAGTLDIFGNRGAFVISATETLSATVSPSVIVQDDATLAVAAGKNLTLGGTLTLGDATNNSGAQYGVISGPGTLTTNAATSIVDDLNTNGAGLYEAFIGGNITWINAATGTVTISGLAEFALNGGGSDNATIINQGNFDFAGNDAQLIQDQPATDKFTNNGTLAKLSGSNTSTLAAAVTSTGLINAAAGTLLLTGGGSLAGTISGAGTVGLSGVPFALASIAGSGNLLLTGGVSTVNMATETIAPNLIIDDNSELQAGSGTITLTGSVTLGDASGYGLFGGPGTISTTGSTSIFDDGANTNALLLNGGVTWANSGTVNDAGAFGVSNDGSVAAITNSGTFNLTSDDAGVESAPNASFTNTGTLAKTSGTGTSTLSFATIANTGLISVASGTLALIASGTGTIGGTLSGAGDLALQYGTFTATGLSGAGTLVIDSATGNYEGVGNASLTNTANLTITDSVIVDGLSTITPADGTTITLTGPVQFGKAAAGDGSYARLVGTGTIVTTGTTTIADLGTNVAVTAESGVTWSNSGTASLGGLFYLRPGCTLNNLAGGVFDLTSNDASITDPYGTAGQINNAGTLAKTGGNSVSMIEGPVTSTGTITSSVGTLALENGATLSGSIGSTGNGVLLLAGGTPYTTGNLLITDHGTQASVTAGNGVSLVNTGFVDDAGIVTLGTTNTDSTSFTNAAGSTFLLLGLDAGITSRGTATITNAGTIMQIGDGIGDGSASIAGTITNNGTIDVNLGALKLVNAVGGTGVERIDATATLEINTAAATQSIVFNGGAGATLKLDHPASRALTGFGTGDRLDLAGVTVSSASVSGTILTVKAGSSTYTFTSSALSGALPTFGTDNTGGSFVSLYRAAIATHAPEPLAFGNVHVGDKPVLALTVTNTAAADGYSENLDAGLATTSAGFSASGTVTGINPQQSDTSSLTATLIATTAGAKSGTATLTLASDGSGVDGRGSTPIASQTVVLTGAAYNYASATMTSNTITLANHHVGDTDTTLLTVTNGAPAGNYSEALDAGFGNTTGAAIAAGSFSGLAAGSSNSSSLTLGLLATTAGAISGSVVLTPTSDGNGIDGLGTTTLGTQVITLSGGVYAYASGTLASSTVNLGIIHANTAASAALTLTNRAPTGGYGESLDAGLSGASTALSTSGSITGLLAGKTDTSTLQLTVNDATSGAYSGSATLGLISDGAGTSGLGTTTLTSQTVTVTATVDNYAVAALEDPSGPALTGTSTNETLNLGSVVQGGAALTASIGARNAATGTADLLGGTFASAGASGFTNSGLGSFTGLSAGQDEHAQSVSLATSTAGTFTETILLSSYGTNASGYNGALATETLTVVGTITQSATTSTYTLALGPNIIHGADGAGDVFIAAAGALNSRDQLTGGNGANSLHLVGAGLFDVNAPSVFSNIPSITATEGQSASGTLADTRQVILMRDSASETLTVAAGKKATGNNNALSITIYGGNGTDTINLASGADTLNLGTGNATVTLGGTTNRVVAGGGTALVHSTAAFANAAVVGASGSNTTLDITTAGNVTLNAADTYLTVKLEAATTLKLSAMQFISVIGSTGADSITAASSNQTLTGGLGADTLTGTTGGGDSFVDTAAGLNGDTIHNWATGDIIDLKDIVEANLHALSYSGNSTQGTLSVTDGTNSSAIKFAGNFGLHSFTVVGADQGGGTLIQWHS
jgi:hypothetical protein